MSSASELLPAVSAWFETAAIRFSTSGALITIFALADFIARRARREPPVPRKPVWLKLLITLSVLGFYALIGPTGGALMNGFGNLAGLALVPIAITMRARSGGAHPELAARCLFYVALPLATGTPWGLLALTLPACAASLWVASRQDDRVRALA